MKEELGFIIFSGYNDRAVITLCRTLVKYNIKFGVVARDSADLILTTKYKINVITFRGEKTLVISDIIDCLIKVKKSIKVTKLVYAPTTEALNRLILENIESIKELINIEVPLVEKELYSRISDKNSFGTLCQNNEILVPKILDLSEKFEYPIVAKPKVYSTDSKMLQNPEIIQDIRNLKLIFKKYNNSSIYFQNFIGGECFYLLYYISKNGKVTKDSQKNLVQQSNGKSMILAQTDKVHLETISYKVEQLLLKLGFYGLVMVELKKFNGNFYMIEANPRFWGPMQLTVDSNSGIMEDFLKDSGFEIEPSNTYNSANYFWFGGLVSEWKNNNIVKYHEFNESQFYNDLNKWLEIDVYNRPDSKMTFVNQLK